MIYQTVIMSMLGNRQLSIAFVMFTVICSKNVMMFSLLDMNLLKQKCLQTLCDLLVCRDPSMLTICLQTIGFFFNTDVDNCDA